MARHVPWQNHRLGLYAYSVCLERHTSTECCRSPWAGAGDALYFILYWQSFLCCQLSLQVVTADLTQPYDAQDPCAHQQTGRGWDHSGSHAWVPKTHWFMMFTYLVSCENAKQACGEQHILAPHLHTCSLLSESAAAAINPCRAEAPVPDHKLPLIQHSIWNGPVHCSFSGICSAIVTAMTLPRTFITGVLRPQGSG
jgi:hypothetical protein